MLSADAGRKRKTDNPIGDRSFSINGLEIILQNASCFSIRKKSL